MTYGESKPGGPYLGMSHARQVLAERLQRFIDSECADLECPHENLPGEGSCSCWGGELRQLPKRTAAQRRKAA